MKRFVSKLSLDQAQSFPLTNAQREIWFDQMKGSNLPNYNIGVIVSIEGSFDIQLIKKSIEIVSGNHDALRTVLIESSDGGVPSQKILENIDIPFEVIDKRNISSAAGRDEAMSVIDEFMNSPFNMEGGLLWRSILFVVGEDAYLWFICCHHLICDGGGLAVFQNDVCIAYNKLLCGEEAIGGNLSLISDALNLDMIYESSDRAQKDRNFWKSVLSSPPRSLFHDLKTRGSGKKHENSGMKTWVIPRASFNIREGLSKSVNT